MLHILSDLNKANKRTKIDQPLAKGMLDSGVKSKIKPIHREYPSTYQIAAIDKKVDEKNMTKGAQSKNPI